MESEINPYVAPQIAPAVPAAVTSEMPPQLLVGKGARRRGYALGCAAALMIGSPVAAAFAIADIKTIVISGAICMVLALVLLLLSRRHDLRRLMSIAIATMVMVIGCFSTIYLNQWDPRDAEIPIGWATVVFACLIQLGWFFVVSVWSAGRISSNQDKGGSVWRPAMSIADPEGPEPPQEVCRDPPASRGGAI